MEYGWLYHFKLALFFASVAFGALSLGNIVPPGYASICSGVLAACWIFEAAMKRSVFAVAIALVFAVVTVDPFS